MRSRCIIDWLRSGRSLGLRLRVLRLRRLSAAEPPTGARRRGSLLALGKWGVKTVAVISLAWLGTQLPCLVLVRSNLRFWEQSDWGEGEVLPQSWWNPISSHLAIVLIMTPLMLGASLFAMRKAGLVPVKMGVALRGRSKYFCVAACGAYMTLNHLIGARPGLSKKARQIFEQKGGPAPRVRVCAHAYVCASVRVGVCWCVFRCVCVRFRVCMYV
jgi:hypothetical protein